MIKPKVNCYYQHRYGGIYMVQDVAKSTIDQSKWVVYVHVFPFEYQTWIRPYDEWTDGRFAELAHEDYDRILKNEDVTEFRNKIISNKAATKR